MKKFLLGLLSFISVFSLFLIYPKSSSAQVYHCQWSFGVCNANTFTEECTASGCSYTHSTCNQLTTDIECGSATFSCNCGTTGSSGINWNDLYSSLGQSGGIFSFSQSLTVGPVVNAFLRYVFPLAGLLLLVYLIWGGFTYLTSVGNPQKMKAAQGVITNALLGFVIIFAAFWIMRVLGVVLGITRITNLFP